MNSATAYSTRKNQQHDERWGALIAQIASGNQEALSEFYDQTNRMVFSLAVRMLNDRSAAEEITLDVFMQVWKQAASFDPERGKPLTWLLTIARNRTIDRMRCSAWMHREQTPLEDVIPFIADYHSPAEGVELREMRAQVRGALAKLKPEQREVIEIAYFGGLTQQEIAEHLNLPLGTVKTRMRTAMLRLRELLAHMLSA